MITINDFVALFSFGTLFCSFGNLWFLVLGHSVLVDSGSAVLEF